MGLRFFINKLEKEYQEMYGDSPNNKRIKTPAGLSRFIIPDEVRKHLDEKAKQNSIAAKGSVVMITAEEEKYIREELRSTTREVVQTMKAIMQRQREEDLEEDEPETASEKEKIKKSDKEANTV